MDEKAEAQRSLARSQSLLVSMTNVNSASHMNHPTQGYKRAMLERLGCSTAREDKGGNKILLATGLAGSSSAGRAEHVK